MMHLSTSSSNHRIPEFPFRVYGLLVFLGMALCFAGVEWLARSNGVMPSIKSTVDFWTLERKKVDTAAVRSLLLVGASRLQTFQPEVFREFDTGYDLINLTAGGKDSILYLEDIANNTAYQGVVLVSILPSSLYENHKQTSEWIQSYQEHHKNLGRIEKQMNTRINVWLQKHFAIMNLSLNEVIDRGIRPSTVVMYPDRHRKMFFENLTQSRRDNYLKTRGLPRNLPNDLESRIETTVARIRKSTDILKSRGATVIFVVYPIPPQRYLSDQKTYPRSIWLDILAAETGCVCIHYTDVTDRRFKLPDNSHLNPKDAAFFTKALTEYMIKEEILTDLPI